METGRFWSICPFGVRNGEILPEFLLLCRRPRNGRFQMETGRFWPICPFRARNGEIKRKRSISGPSALLGPVFKRKRAVSGSSAFLGPEMVKFCRNFCSCAVDQEMAVFKRKTGCFWPICPFGVRNGEILPKFLLLCCRPRNGRF